MSENESALLIVAIYLQTKSLHLPDNGSDALPGVAAGDEEVAVPHPVPGVQLGLVHEQRKVLHHDLLDQPGAIDDEKGVQQAIGAVHFAVQGRPLSGVLFRALGEGPEIDAQRPERGRKVGHALR